MSQMDKEKFNHKDKRRKLTDLQYTEIRDKYRDGMSINALSIEYEVRRYTIKRIIDVKTKQASNQRNKEAAQRRRSEGK